jgi:hypothetical protein
VTESPPTLGLDAAQVMKARDYLVVVDTSEQVHGLAPDMCALSELDIGIRGTIVTAPGERVTG